MSVIIKSNNVANVSFGTSAMVGTTAQYEFDRYKARVLADGGVIKNEARTLSAFKLLFNTKMFGHMNTFVSGSFGAKVNSGGGITKLYAIDGSDLIGTAYGTGTLPTLSTLSTADYISFAANSGTDKINGGMFSTAKPINISKAGSFGYAIRNYSSGAAATQYFTLAGLSNHDDKITSISPSVLDISKDSVDILHIVKKNPLASSVNSEVLRIKFNVGVTPLISFLSQPNLPYQVGARSGTEVTTMSTDKPFAEIKSEPFYLDFGGLYTSAEKKFSIASVIDFMCFGQATREQAVMLSSFSL